MFKLLTMSFTESNGKRTHILNKSDLKLTLSGISLIEFLRKILAVIERLDWGSSYKTIARPTNFIEQCNLWAKRCNHNCFDGGLSIVPLWMRTLAPSMSMFPSPPLSKNSKLAASIHYLTACRCNYRVLAYMQRNTWYDLNCLQNKMCVLHILIFSGRVKNTIKCREKVGNISWIALKQQNRGTFCAVCV